MGLVAMQSVLAAAPVAKQSNPFEGAYGQIGVGYEITKISGAGGRDGGISYIPNNRNNDKGLAGTIAAGYNFAVQESFVLGVGVEYSPLHGHKGQITSGANNTLRNYSKDRMYNFFLSPGYVVNKDGLAYAKVGYTKMNEKFITAGRADVSNSIGGYSLGVGYKQFIINQSVYGFGEVNYARYKDFSDGSGMTGVHHPDSTNFLVGIGIKF